MNLSYKNLQLICSITFCLLLIYIIRQRKPLKETTPVEKQTEEETASEETTTEENIDKIDVVISWSGHKKPHQNGTDVARERYNNELPFQLRSIAKNAPWVQKIHILVNTGVEPLDPELIPPSVRHRTQFLDRCTIMPRDTCPTRNSHSIKAYVHRIPGLTERFLLVDDDVFLGRPVTPSDFFENGKPFVWRKKATWGFFAGQEFHRIYKDPSVFSFPTPKSSAPSPHFWYPQLKSVCFSMEDQYPEFYAFVASHKEGRYSSLAKGPNDLHNSQEECLMGWMNFEYIRTNKGIFKNIDSKRGFWWEEADISEQGFIQVIKDKPIFLNVNDRFSTDPSIYDKQIKWFHEAMDILFPKE